MLDQILELLFDDGTARDGSLRFLEQALRYPEGQGFTYTELAADLGVFT